MGSLQARTFAIFALVIGACQFMWSQPGQTQLLQSTASCLGRIQDTAGHVVQDFGTVSMYTAYFPEDANHQGQCTQDVFNAATTWLSNPGQMCHAFFAASSSELIYYYKLGDHPWKDATYATDASTYNYPNSCFNNSGTVFPSYYVLSVIYTPPGCTPSTVYNCGAGSFVSYGSTSSRGTTVSIEHSTAFLTSLTVNAASAVNLGFSYSETNASGSASTLTVQTSDTIKWPEPGPVSDDAIHHDFDQFELLLNPAVAMTGWHDPITGQNHVQWSLGTKNGAPGFPQRVQVSYLRCALAGIGPRPGNSGGDPTYDPMGSCSAKPYLQMPGVPDASAANGFLPGLSYDDYKQILAQDLFWNASPSNPILIPTSRFVPLSQDYVYDPPSGGQDKSCSPQTKSFSITKSETQTSSTTTEYQASMSLSAPFQISLASTASFTWMNKATWTYKKSNSSTTTDSQSATATVLCASAAWTGPYQIAAYYDTVYGTLLLALDDGTGRARLLEGTITDMDGDGVPHEPLKLVVGNETYQTFSRNNGHFQFRLPVGQASAGATTGTLGVDRVGATSNPVAIGPAAIATVTIPTPPPVLTVGRGTAPVVGTGMNERVATGVSAVPIYVAITNRSLFATAKNVTITSVEARSSTGAALVYNGTLPLTMPGGAALKADTTVNVPLAFNNVGGPLSFLSVTVKADNLVPFSTVLIGGGVLQAQ